LGGSLVCRREMLNLRMKYVQTAGEVQGGVQRGYIVQTSLRSHLLRSSGVNPF